jgi:hypothetical protein
LSPDRRVEIDRGRLGDGLGGGGDPGGPHAGVVLREDDALEVVLGVGEQVLRNDHSLLAGRHLRTGLDDVERGHGPDLHPDLVLLEELLGEVEAVVGGPEVVHGVDEVVVVDLRGRHRVDDRLAELDVRDLAVDLGELELPAGRVDLEVREQRLGDADGDARRVGRVEAGEEVVRVGPPVVPGHVELAPGLDRESGSEVPDVRLRVDDLAAAEEAGRLVVPRSVVEVGEQKGVVETLGGDHALGGDLRIVLLDLDVDVVGEGLLHRVVQRQPQDLLLLLTLGRRAGDEPDREQQGAKRRNPSSHVLRDLQACLGAVRHQWKNDEFYPTGARALPAPPGMHGITL